MEYFPLFLRLQHKPCLIVGGGEVAHRKVNALLKSGACLTVQAPRLCAALQQLVDEQKLTWFAEPFQEQDPLNSFFLVVAATDDGECNRIIAERCSYLGIHCNATSQTDEGDALLPAIIDRAPLIVTVHSDGQAPTVTRYLKRQLEAFIPRKFGTLASWAEHWRQQVAKQLPDMPVRRRFWHRQLSGVAGTHVLSDHSDRADKILNQSLAAATEKNHTGEVYLVGAGPGDPELLTLKALRLLQQADIVLYDRLVSQAIMDLIPEDCERLYVGKRRSEHSVPQGQINQLLVDHARRGLNVLRLKGGDPFIFGRGGEEIDLLAESGIHFQVVPGITAASGCACYAGIPLTHRDHAQSVRFITGHLQQNTVNLNWPELAQPRQTLVFYMGLSGLEQICSTLIAHGRSEETAAALVEKGTLPNQKIITGTLASLPALAVQQSAAAPTLLIVGEVVGLQRQLAWFDPPPEGE